jgi:hypothetical protein
MRWETQCSFLLPLQGRQNKGSRGLSLNPLKFSTFCRQSAFMFSAWLSAQRVIRSLYGINLLGFITEAELFTAQHEMNS